MNFVDKHNLIDRSTPEEFSFALNCSECGELRESTPIPFSKAGVEPGSEGKRIVYEALYRKEKELAMEKAVRELRGMFSECPICRRRVCDLCFLICEELDMCVSCAEDLREQGEPVSMRNVAQGCF